MKLNISKDYHLVKEMMINLSDIVSDNFLRE